MCVCVSKIMVEDIVHILESTLATHTQTKRERAHYVLCVMVSDHISEINNGIKTGRSNVHKPQ